MEHFLYKLCISKTFLLNKIDKKIGDFKGKGDNETVFVHLLFVFVKAVLYIRKKEKKVSIVIVWDDCFIFMDNFCYNIKIKSTK